VRRWKYGSSGRVGAAWRSMLWELTFTGASKDIWRDPRNSIDRELVHNLAGQLAYPARPGIEEPVTSIRPALEPPRELVQHVLRVAE